MGKTQTWDAGVDLSFLDSRFTLTFDFYNRLTNNSFYARPVSYMASGQTSITAMMLLFVTEVLSWN